MLKAIKNMINRKEAFIEAASIIFEDTTWDNLDNLIILGESEDASEEDPKEDNEDPIENNENDEEDVMDNDNEEDLMDQPIDGSYEGDDSSSIPVSQGEGDDLLGVPLDGNSDSIGLDTPEVAEEVLDVMDDILNVSIDLSSNTINDILPVPPANAGEALADNGGDELLTSRIDSGFGDDDASDGTSLPSEEENPNLEQVDDLLGESIEPNNDKKDESGNDKSKLATDILGSKMSDTEKIKSMSQLFGEGISLGEEPSEETGGDLTPTASSGSDTPEGGDTPASGGEESDVTAAVMDKVSEVDDGMGDDGGFADPKTEIMDKLDSLNRNILNAKETVKKVLQ